MKRINLPKNKRARLCRTFGTSGVTVWSALNYVTNMLKYEGFLFHTPPQKNVNLCHLISIVF